LVDIGKTCPGCSRKVLDRFGQHLFHCDKSVSAPLRNKFHAALKISVANALAAPMRGVGLTVQENEPHMSTHFEPAQPQQTTQTESQDQDEFEVTPGVESRADLLFKDQDGGKAILIDVTSASGLSRYVKLHRYSPGAVAELAEQRKTKAYSRLWNVESERARLIFFAVELSGCFGPEAQQMCKTVVEMGGDGPEALREVYESLSIGFQVNRALRIEHMMKRSLYGGLGLGGEEVRGLG
jgi:hypothetical protein